MSTTFDGKTASTEILRGVKERVAKMSHKPKLTIVQTSDSDKHNRYTNIKKKAAETVGIDCEIMKLPETVSEAELIAAISKINDSDGILVQLPLPENIDKFKVFNEIPYENDVEGLSAMRSGDLFEKIPNVYSPTAKGVIYALQSATTTLEGKNCVIAGKSFLIGKPVALALTHLGATVTLCGSRTINLADHTRHADVVIGCSGQKHLITADMVKNGAIVIDAGYEVVDGKAYGDVHPDVAAKASFFTPVPGGIGPLTVAFIFQNLLDLVDEQK